MPIVDGSDFTPIPSFSAGSPVPQIRIPTTRPVYSIGPVRATGSPAQITVSSSNLTPTIDEQPDTANTPSTMVGNLETSALAAVQAAANTQQIVAPNGPMPFDTTDPNFLGLPWTSGALKQITQTNLQNNSLGLLFIIFALWALFGRKKAA